MAAIEATKIVRPRTETDLIGERSGWFFEPKGLVMVVVGWVNCNHDPNDRIYKVAWKEDLRRDRGGRYHVKERRPIYYLNEDQMAKLLGHSPDHIYPGR